MKDTRPLVVSDVGAHKMVAPFLILVTVLDESKIYWSFDCMNLIKSTTRDE